MVYFVLGVIVGGFLGMFTMGVLGDVDFKDWR